jgi:hypothetical protein
MGTYQQPCPLSGKVDVTLAAIRLAPYSVAIPIKVRTITALATVYGPRSGRSRRIAVFIGCSASGRTYLQWDISIAGWTSLDELRQRNGADRHETNDDHGKRPRNATAAEAAKSISQPAR